jgi:RHS repeat-associated protein
MRLWKILLALLLVLTGSGPSALASIPLAPENPCTGHFRGVVSGCRYYSPTLGRWIGRDPIGENGGMNLLAFVENNPCTSIDRFGDATLSDLGAAAGVAGTLGAAAAENAGEVQELAGGVVEEVEALTQLEVEAGSSTKLLNQFNSVDSLIQQLGKLSPSKNAIVGQVNAGGNANAVFNALTQGGKVINSAGTVEMENGDQITLYPSTSMGGVPTLQINIGGALFKIRIF